MGRASTSVRFVMTARAPFVNPDAIVCITATATITIIAHAIHACRDGGAVVPPARDAHEPQAGGVQAPGCSFQAQRRLYVLPVHGHAARWWQ